MTFENVPISLMREQPSLECGSDAAALVCIKLFNSHKPLCPIKGSLTFFDYEKVKVFDGF